VDDVDNGFFHHEPFPERRRHKLSLLEMAGEQLIREILRQRQSEPDHNGHVLRVRDQEINIHLGDMRRWMAWKEEQRERAEAARIERLDGYQRQSVEAAERSAEAALASATTARLAYRWSTVAVLLAALAAAASTVQAYYAYRSTLAPPPVAAAK
jgi:hypothetical protein